MATVHADPESQEKIDDGTAKGGWTWPWILAVVLGLVVVVLLVLWGVGVFDGSKSELNNERIVVLPMNHAWETIADANQVKLTIGWEYKPQNGRYILINKDDEEKVKEWANEIILEAAVEGKDAVTLATNMRIYSPLVALNFANDEEKTGDTVTKAAHADEITTYRELADAMKRLANTVSAIAQHRARLAIKTLKLADRAADGTADLTELQKMTPNDEIDEVVKIANKIKEDIKSFVEDVLIPTAQKINIQVLEPEEKDDAGAVTKAEVRAANPREMIVELLQLFVEQGVPIADQFIALKERIAKDIVHDQKTIADILTPAGKTAMTANTVKASNDQDKTYDEDQKAFDELKKGVFEGDDGKLSALRKTHNAVEAEYLREMANRARGARGVQQQQIDQIVAIHHNCMVNIRALPGRYVRDIIGDVFSSRDDYDAHVRDLERSGRRYVHHLIGAPIPAEQPQGAAAVPAVPAAPGTAAPAAAPMPLSAAAPVLPPANATGASQPVPPAPENAQPPPTTVAAPPVGLAQDDPTTAAPESHASGTAPAPSRAEARPVDEEQTRPQQRGRGNRRKKAGEEQEEHGAGAGTDE